MSVQAVSRIAALLALDAEVLKQYLPEDNEEYRSDFAHLYRGQLTGQEKTMVAGGDVQEIFQYLADHLPKPVNGEDPEGGG